MPTPFPIFLDKNQSAKIAFISKFLPYLKYSSFTMVAALIKMSLVKNVFVLESKTKIRFKSRQRASKSKRYRFQFKLQTIFLFGSSMTTRYFFF